jgi:hypothetical protein
MGGLPGTGQSTPITEQDKLTRSHYEPCLRSDRLATPPATCHADSPPDLTCNLQEKSDVEPELPPALAAARDNLTSLILGAAEVQVSYTGEGKGDRRGN